jgi:hypothetical protein
MSVVVLGWKRVFADQPLRKSLSRRESGAFATLNSHSAKDRGAFKPGLADLRKRVFVSAAIPPDSLTGVKIPVTI